MNKGIELSDSEAAAFFTVLDELQQATYQAKCFSHVLSEYACAKVIDHDIDRMSALLVQLDIGLGRAQGLAEDALRAFRQGEQGAQAGALRKVA